MAADTPGLDAANSMQQTQQRPERYETAVSYKGWTATSSRVPPACAKTAGSPWVVNNPTPLFELKPLCSAQGFGP